MNDTTSSTLFALLMKASAILSKGEGRLRLHRFVSHALQNEATKRLISVHVSQRQQNKLSMLTDSFEFGWFLPALTPRERPRLDSKELWDVSDMR
jgi:hypothetical protein